MLLEENQKFCCRCRKLRPLDDFTFKDQAKGTLHGYCRVCHAEWNHQHYLRNKATYVATARRNNAAYQARNMRRIVEFLIAHPCVDCGERDPVVLDFDHRDPASKTVEVGSLLRYAGSWAALEREIAKCEVRCANCHRRRTAQQFGWRKVALTERLRAGAEGIEPPTAAFGVRCSA